MVQPLPAANPSTNSCQRCSAMQGSKDGTPSGASLSAGGLSWTALIQSEKSVCCIKFEWCGTKAPLGYPYPFGNLAWTCVVNCESPEHRQGSFEIWRCRIPWILWISRCTATAFYTRSLTASNLESFGQAIQLIQVPVSFETPAFVFAGVVCHVCVSFTFHFICSCPCCACGATGYNPYQVYSQMAAAQSARVRHTDTDPSCETRGIPHMSFEWVSKAFPFPQLSGLAGDPGSTASSKGESSRNEKLRQNSKRATKVTKGQVSSAVFFVFPYFVSEWCEMLLAFNHVASRVSEAEAGREDKRVLVSSEFLDSDLFDSPYAAHYAARCSKMQQDGKSGRTILGFRFSPESAGPVGCSSEPQGALLQCRGLILHMSATMSDVDAVGSLWCREMSSSQKMGEIGWGGILLLSQHRGFEIEELFWSVIDILCDYLLWITYCMILSGFLIHFTQAGGFCVHLTLRLQMNFSNMRFRWDKKHHVLWPFERLSFGLAFSFWSTLYWGQLSNSKLNTSFFVILCVSFPYP